MVAYSISLVLGRIPKPLFSMLLQTGTLMYGYSVRPEARQDHRNPWIPWICFRFLVYFIGPGKDLKAGLDAWDSVNPYGFL